ncbi:MAG: hypothetical protein LBP53_06960 [Candidatus Peribacteria bacterium]|nr:hypothetical protein [Candidatus Peribacteria bacterium]
MQEVSEMKPYYVVSHEELFPILIDEIVLDVEEEKEILARDLKNNPAWKPVKDKLLALLPQFSFVLNRQLPRGSHIPLLKVEGEYQLENAHIFFERKDVDALQSCFDYSLVCLIREQYLVGPLTSGKLLTTFAQTSDEIKGFFQGLALHRKKPTKVMEKAMDTFLEMIIHFIDDEKMIEKFEQLIQNSSCLRESPDGLQLVWPS